MRAMRPAVAVLTLAANGVFACQGQGYSSSLAMLPEAVGAGDCDGSFLPLPPDASPVDAARAAFEAGGGGGGACAAPPAFPLHEGFATDAPIVRILHDGDSRAHGYSTLPADGGTPYARTVGLLLGSRVDSIDIARDASEISVMATDSDFAAHVAPMISLSPPTIVTVMAGVNDLHQSLGVTATWAAMQRYCAHVRAAGARVVILGDPDALSSIGAATSADYRALEATSVPTVADGYVDPGAAFTFPVTADRWDAGTWGAWYSDGLHPNQNGHTRLAFAVAAVLAPMAD